VDPLTEKLTQVFRDVFDDETLSLRDEMVAADVEGWDSLNHVRLVVAVESAFRVKFSTREVVGWKTVGDLRKSLQAKVRP
jgi:acyl carrier protein